jgi:pimeloyl-ACP methyl ester carboxylesterase
VDKGAGPITVVFESRLGGFSAEWCVIQEEVANHTRTVSYDRAGYGWSGDPTTDRDPASIAQELYSLLQTADVPGPYLIVGHSQGGLYAQQFARLYPQAVAGAIFIDPASPSNRRFKDELPLHVYRQSGVDKLPGMQMAQALARLGVGPLLKRLMLKSPPFYYYREMPPEVVQTIWRHHLRASTWRTAVSEYNLAFTEESNKKLLMHPFPRIPVVVLYHTPRIIIDEIVKYGGFSVEDATKVEAIWEQLTREYLELSPDSQWVGAEHSSHFIPQESPILVATTIREMLALMASRR